MTTKKQLHLGKDVALPLDAVTKTFGVLAVRGAGKSNLARVMAEEMYEHGLPFVAIDPVGSWWGLRSSRDGKQPGLSLPIFGGKHADVPLEKTGGQLVAELVAAQRMSAVLDVSEFTEGEKTRFLTDFAEALYRKNQDPLHLFLEEADDYCPQKPYREQARLLRAWENIVRRGRSRGLGITMITQRSASINKSVLTQIETLFVLRITSPQDRKAIEAWVTYHGQAKELLESLAGLQAGEAWMWSPAWLAALTRFQARLSWTWDSGATPKDLKGKRPAATLADVDLAAIQTRMAETIERAKSEDPRELRRQIADLKKQLGQKSPAPRALSIDQSSIDKAVQRAIGDRDRHWQGELKKQLAAQRDLRGRLAKIASMAAVNGEAVEVSHPSPPERSAVTTLTNDNQTSGYFSVIRRERRAEKSVEAYAGEPLGKAEQAVLLAVHWLVGEEATKEKVSFYSGYSVKSSSFANALGKLRSLGLVEGFAITDSGAAVIGDAPAKPTGPELRNWLAPKLSKAENALLDVLVARWPAKLTNEELSAASGYSAGSSSFANALGTLRTIAAAEGYEKFGGTKAADVLVEG